MVECEDILKKGFIFCIVVEGVDEEFLCRDVEFLCRFWKLINECIVWFILVMLIYWDLVLVICILWDEVWFGVEKVCIDLWEIYGNVIEFVWEFILDVE